MTTMTTMTTRPGEARTASSGRARWFGYGFLAGALVVGFVMAIIEDDDEDDGVFPPWDPSKL
jgi:hypothetical protein